MWDLVSRYLDDGEEEAFVSFVAAHRGLVKHLCWRHIPHLLRFADLEEIVDETFYRSLREVRERGIPWHRDPSSWVGGHCLNVIKSKTLRPEAPGSGGEDAAAEDTRPGKDERSPLELVAEAELHAAAEDCVDALEERLKDVFQMIFRDEWTNTRAANELGCSEAYVRQGLIPGLERKVRECLELKGFEGLAG